ncbi:MAG TPA: YdcF family protein [Terriglobales bacterium]|nr:YdcF family protein [Terriglobales bacterium]
MRRARFRTLAALALLGAILWGALGGRFLVVDAPEKSDAILVLEGEAGVRLRRALELLRQGWAPRVLLDVREADSFYGTSKIDLAQKWIASLPPEDAARMSICPFDALSTQTEAREAERCLKAMGARSVLIVTSDYHTRRARAIFRHELPGMHFSAAAACDPESFTPRWWRARQTAKTFLDESLKLGWFEVVDRWR